MNYSKVHLLGAGGIGVSAAGKYFLLHNIKVTGADLHLNRQTTELTELGAQITEGNGEELIDSETDLILYSPAVPENNPARQKAKELNIPQISYPEFLGQLSETRKTIAISGTNGKSTTTAMIAKILIDAGYDPMVFLGTESPDFSHGNYHHGQGVWLIVEACEYKAAMLNIKPHLAVITNIELDHLDYYKNINHIKETFQQWIDPISSFDGYVILNSNDEVSTKLNRPDAIFAKLENRMTGNQLQSFQVQISGDPTISGKFSAKLSIPGEFNAENASLAIATAKTVRVNEEIIKSSLQEFSGTWRRFEFLGQFHQAKVFSDYAHHPTSIKGLIQATKEQFPQQKIAIIFEPHQHARTKELFSDFLDSFSEADLTIITDIYGVAGRTENDQISSENLVQQIKKQNPELNISYQKTPEQALNSLKNQSDIILIVGAGTIYERLRPLINK